MKIVNQKRTAIIHVDNVQMIGLATVSDGHGAVRAGNIRGTEVQTLGIYKDIATAQEVLMAIAGMNDNICFGMPPEDWTPPADKGRRAETVVFDGKKPAQEGNHDSDHNVHSMRSTDSRGGMGHGQEDKEGSAPDRTLESLHRGGLAEDQPPQGICEPGRD